MSRNWGWEEERVTRPHVHCIFSIKDYKEWKLNQLVRRFENIKSASINRSEYFTSKNRKKFDSLCERFESELKVINDFFEDALSDTLNYLPFEINNQIIGISKTVGELHAVFEEVEKTYHAEVNLAFAKKFEL